MTRQISSLNWMAIHCKTLPLQAIEGRCVVLSTDMQLVPLLGEPTELQLKPGVTWHGQVQCAAPQMHVARHYSRGSRVPDLFRPSGLQIGSISVAQGLANLSKGTSPYSLRKRMSAASKTVCANDLNTGLPAIQSYLSSPCLPTALPNLCLHYLFNLLTNGRYLIRHS
jgi:hypothetical protein